MRVSQARNIRIVILWFLWPLIDAWKLGLLIDLATVKSTAVNIGTHATQWHNSLLSEKTNLYSLYMGGAGGSHRVTTARGEIGTGCLLSHVG